MKKLAALITLLLVVGGYLAYSTFVPQDKTIAITQPIPDKANVALAAQPETESQKVISADGEANALLEAVDNGDDTRSYSLYVCEATCDNKQLLYQTNLPEGEKLQVPFNAWSPNNQYLYIQKLGGTTGYYVFKANGESFSDDTKYIDVSPVFATKQPDLSLQDVTGWDSSTLLHVATLKSDGESGPKFWFEVPSQALIQLAR